MFAEVKAINGFQNKLSNSETSELLEPVLNAIQLGVIIADKYGEIVYINPSFTMITGLKSEQRIGKNIFETAPHCPLSKALITGKSSYGERFKMYDAPMEILANTKPIFVNNETIGAVSIFQDVSEVEKLNRKLMGTKKTIRKLNNKLVNITVAKYEFDDILGDSTLMNKAKEMAKRAAKTELVTLILGESGTGKELISHSIHNASKRRDKPFIKVNCAAIPENLLESEFFGYEKGAFTGANHTKLGMFELANEGTIFLDEIGDMSLGLQSKLLRVLEDKEIYRVGGIESISIDVRVIAATHCNLKEMVRKGLFRKDLYYRLDVMNVKLPPLRDREDDMIILAEKFLENICQRLQIKHIGFSDCAYKKLRGYNWPGNVRELRNTIEKAVVIADGNLIMGKDLQFISLIDKPETTIKDLMSLDAMEKQMIKLALDKLGSTVAGKKRIAETLNISLRTLYNKIKKYELE